MSITYVIVPSLFLHRPVNRLSSIMEQKTKLVVLGLIKNNKNRYLVSVRNDPKVSEAHLKYDFVGGTNEFGESLEETLIREVEEESGLKVKITAMLPWTTSKVWKHDDYLMHTVVFCYLCSFVSGKLSVNDPKIDSFEWKRLEDINTEEFLPTTKFFIEKLKAVGVDNL